MNCDAVPLQSPVSHSAHWVEKDNKFEPQRGSTMNQSGGIPFINLKVVSVLSSIQHRASSIQFHDLWNAVGVISRTNWKTSQDGSAKVDPSRSTKAFFSPS